MTTRLDKRLSWSTGKRLPRTIVSDNTFVGSIRCYHNLEIMDSIANYRDSSRSNVCSLSLPSYFQEMMRYQEGSLRKKRLF